jgi:hypothetical protein
VHNLNFIDEIVVNIEPTDQPHKDIFGFAKNYRKVRCEVNEKRLHVFRNKIATVKKCRSEWVAQIDSDNIIGANYFYPFLKTENKSDFVIYAPEFAMTKFNFAEFIGLDIGMKEAVGFFNKPIFNVLINTMNYLFHRERWLKAVEKAYQDEYDPKTADSAWINLQCWRAGMVMRVMPGMIYKHTIHPESTYLQDPEAGVREYAKIQNMMREEIKNESGLCAGSVQTQKQDTVSSSPVWSATGRSGRAVVPGVEGTKQTDIFTD